MRRKVSVAMAVYNGEKFLKQQLDSVLSQLSDTDEVIVSLDPSTDKSKDIIDSYGDKRIKVVKGPGRGLIANFENAIRHTKNDIIFLCDQDDVWLPDKVDKVLLAFNQNQNVMVVLHDAIVIDERLNIVNDSYFSFRKSKLGVLSNIIKNSYIGCCMAFSKELIPYILPFPKDLPMHDQWIGLTGEKKGTNVLLGDKLILYRRHEENASNIKHSGIIQMLKWRKSIVKSLCSIHSNEIKK